MNAGKVWAQCLPCGSLHFLQDGGAERVTIGCKAHFTLVSPLCSRASGDVILVSCLTWLQFLFPSQRTAPSKPMVSTDQPPAVQFEGNALSPGWLVCPRERRCFSHVCWRKWGWEMSPPRGPPIPSRCLPSLPSHASPEGNWLEVKEIEAGGGGPISHPLSWRI